MNISTSIRSIRAQQITPDRFNSYGQVIFPSEDGKLYDETDAVLKLTDGIPRFYIMRLTHRGRRFDRITRHVQCTQCLGSLAGKNWWMAVAPPTTGDRPEIERLQVFQIPGDCFIKLEVGTWHAGPYFEADFIDFYNLELSDTNLVDRFTYNFARNDKITFEIT